MSKPNIAYHGQLHKTTGNKLFVDLFPDFSKRKNKNTEDDAKKHAVHQDTS